MQASSEEEMRGVGRTSRKGKGKGNGGKGEHEGKGENLTAKECSREQGQ